MRGNRQEHDKCPIFIQHYIISADSCQVETACSFIYSVLVVLEAFDITFVFQL